MYDRSDRVLHMNRRTFVALASAATVGGCLPFASAQQQKSSGISIKAEGDPVHGYAVVISYNGVPITCADPGELDAIFQNDDRSLEDRVQRWKATSWSGDERQITLTGDAYLPNTNATVRLHVNYQVVEDRIVKKVIRIRQSDMFLLHYQCTTTIEPRESPAKFWSFDQVTCQGGALREYFPAAGFRTSRGLVVGALTDAGYRNGWSRMYRRDGKPIKPAPAAIPDPNLYVVSNEEDHQRGRYFIRQTFGAELRALAHASPTPVELSSASEWKQTGTLHRSESNGSMIVTSSAPDATLIIPFQATAGTTYLVEFEYRSEAEVAIALCSLDKDSRVVENFNQFNDRTPASPQQWATFHSTVFIADILTSRTALTFSLPESGTAHTKTLELRNLRLSSIPAITQPYHRLPMDQEAQITTFIFAEENVADTHRGYRLSSQLNLAEALNFEGGETEKVLYADLMMLCWNAGVETFRPMLAPSIYYSAAGEMYLRDSFFALNGCHNRELNEQVFNLWAENQGEDGAINTLIEPEMTNLERKSNDSTPLWLIWALLNQRRFGITPPADKIRRAAQYCLHTFDPNGDGLCHAQFVMGQLDIVSYPEGTTTICQNQGLLAVTLRVIRELNISGISESLTDAHIENAEQIYRSYYDPSRGFMRPTRDVSDAIGFAELFPEYLSLLLFRRKILTDEMMIRHLNQIPVMLHRTDCPFPEEGGTVRPVFIGLTDKPGGWRFFTEKWHPLAYDSYAASYAMDGMDGIYYNGGSWMRIEICCYVAGLLHGWPRAERAIKNRLWAEINVDPEFPTSQEYLATDPGHPFFGYHRVFAWNASVLQALELAGMRTPPMDPNYRPNRQCM
jgi:hypothetical protein